MQKSKQKSLKEYSLSRIELYALSYASMYLGISVALSFILMPLGMSSIVLILDIFLSMYTIREPKIINIFYISRIIFAFMLGDLVDTCMYLSVLVVYRVILAIKKLIPNATTDLIYFCILTVDALVSISLSLPTIVPTIWYVLMQVLLLGSLILTLSSLKVCGALISGKLKMNIVYSLGLLVLPVFVSSECMLITCSTISQAVIFISLYAWIIERKLVK